MLGVRDLALVRGERRLASGLQFDLPAGRALRIAGANGSGKTTLLRTLCGLRPARGGQVLWNGVPLPRAGDALREELVCLGHHDGLHEDLTAAENLQVLMSLGGEAVTPGAIAAALATAGLQGQQYLPVRSLSQGQRRRAALARLALTRKRLWVLDEPLAALDAEGRAAFIATLQRHLLGGGLAVFTCHADSWSHTESIQCLSLPGPQ
ncbi:cytochrome c biogenesis heme-transporting ATPase CcmA [Caldimonas brevitalea]|uniref:Heme exporter protein A n=1 Tax=Caldimonas brevitalea TaxID=413882 RepID=A0A0G3BP55_9BURK|nr:cytochrome c biogenesis heme-transporting ATPase CcmA [Caldimonas brevitalea]AKJ28315.1 heme exporter protein A [Caldimonas brevitalea]